MAKVPVYRKDTGEQVYVPEHWVGHPALGGPFTLDAPAADVLDVESDPWGRPESTPAPRTPKPVDLVGPPVDITEES